MRKTVFGDMLVSKERGITLIIALILVAILLAVALAILGFTINASANASSVAVKTSAFNAAEAGLNQAISNLDANKHATPDPQPCAAVGTLNNVAYTKCIVVNNISTSATAAPATTATDPATGKTINIPGDSAYVYGLAGSSVGRRTYAEAIVVPATPFPFPAGNGVNGTMDVVDDCNWKISLKTDIHANNNILWNKAVSSPSPMPVTGATYGHVSNNLPGTGGMYTGALAPIINLPSPTQMNDFAANALAVAKSGASYTPVQALVACATSTGGCSGNVYIGPGNFDPAGASVTFKGGGTVYFDGNVIYSAGAIINQPDSTIVIANTFSVAGLGKFQDLTPSGKPTIQGELIVMGTTTDPSAVTPCGTITGCVVSFLGNSSPEGLIYAPFGNVQIGGNGNQNGAVFAGTTPNQSGGTIDFHGCGVSGGFNSSGTFQGAPHDGTWRIAAYWEY